MVLGIRLQSISFRPSNPLPRIGVSLYRGSNGAPRPRASGEGRECSLIWLRAAEPAAMHVILADTAVAYIR